MLYLDINTFSTKSLLVVKEKQGLKIYVSKFSLWLFFPIIRCIKYKQRVQFLFKTTHMEITYF